MSDPVAHGDDEREDLPPGERQMTSADLTAHDDRHGEVRGGGEAEADEPDDLDRPDALDEPDAGTPVGEGPAA